jgi:hypothetical protein
MQVLTHLVHRLVYLVAVVVQVQQQAQRTVEQVFLLPLLAAQ